MVSEIEPSYAVCKASVLVPILSLSPTLTLHIVFIILRVGWIGVRDAGLGSIN